MVRLDSCVTILVFCDTMSVTIDPSAKLKEWAFDTRAYCRDLLKVQSVEGGLVPLKLNEVQELFFSIIEDIKNNGRLVRVVVLKARRQGLSTATAGRFFHKVATRPNKYGAIICHEPDSAEFVFNMYRRMYQNLPDVMKPSTKYNSIRRLEFNRPDGKGLDSAIRVAAAGREDIGSGMMINYFHGSESAKWPSHTAEQIMTSVMQAVPQEPDTEVILESTAKGIGGLFYTRFMDARYVYTAYLDGDGSLKFKMDINEDTSESNMWASVFFPWFCFKRYSMKCPPGFVMTEQERELKATYALSTQQLAWRRWAIENNCGGSEQVFMQEYPACSREAFLSTGSPVFDLPKLMAIIKDLKPPIARYGWQQGTGNFLADQGGNLMVWREPIPGRSYVISADVAEGIEVSSDTDEKSKYDFSCADVIDQLSGEQVAHWHGKIAPDLFAHLLFHLGKRYNTAWMVPERNGHGMGVVTSLFTMRYPKLWVEKVPDPPGKPRKRYGWLTSTATKPMIIDNLVAAVRDGTHGINNKDTINEMLSFKRNPDGTMEAEKNQHDDRLMSYAIGQFVRTRLPMPSGTQRRPEDAWTMPTETAPVPSSRAWL